MARTRVKICGVTTVADALAACDAGADAIGLNFVDNSPRYVGNAFHAIVAALPPFVVTVGVFVDADEILVESLRADLDVLQFHGREDAKFCRDFFQAPQIRAVRVGSSADLEQLRHWNHARAILLDGAGKAGAHGGATFDWSLFEEARRLTTRPLILAGGLTPQNVGDAIRATRPAGVDVASGVESSPGKKDPAKMRAFVAAVRAAAIE